MIDLSLPWQVVEGDCLDVMLDVPAAAVGAVISDPPYGMFWDVDTVRFSGGVTRRGVGKTGERPVHGDDAPFDPAPWLDFPAVVMFGSNHYAQRLPVGTTLVWVKRTDAAFGTFLSDAEVGWEKGGRGVYCFTMPHQGVNAEAGVRVHPTQKPVALMEWCIGRQQLAPNSLIIDPYCGSGTTGVAAVQMGYRFIGIEREPQYVSVARRRIADAAAQGNLFHG